MISRILAYCFRHRQIAIALAILLALLGYYAWTQVAIEAYPELAPVTVQVTTQVPGLASEDMEQEVTIPLERALGSTPQLVSFRSTW